MLGYVTGAGTGEANRVIAEVARDLGARGWRLAGFWQVDVPRAGRRREMTLRPVDGAAPLRISLDRGTHARGCRLDAGALEQAAARVEAALRADPPPRLLVVNKFGKLEAEGRGFRLVIGEALAREVPVLTSVNDGERAAFAAFLGGLGEALPPDPAAVARWAEAHAPG